MSITQTSYLFDLLAPRVYRQIVHTRARPVGVGQRRSGSSAAVLRPEEERLEDRGVTSADGEGEPAVAGASRNRDIVGDKAVKEEARRSRRGYARESWGISFGPEESSNQSCAGPSTSLNPVGRPQRRLRKPLYPNTHKSPSQPQPKYPNLTSHFLRPNPPSTCTLFPPPVPLTKPSGDLLIRYAQRIDNREAERSIKDAMGRMRIAPVSWISTSKTPRRRVLDTSQMSIGENVNGEQGFGSGDDPPLIPRVPISIAMRELRNKSNTWARRMWPPNPLPLTPVALAKYESNYPYTFLCRQHHLILNSVGKREGFIDALRQLEKLPGVEDGDLLSLLHLYLAYPSSPKSEESLLTPLYQLLLHAPHLNPTRQTLHLLILSTLDYPHPTGANIRSEIQNLLTLFRTQWGIMPGCESWRHITRYALHLDDKVWAREGWEGWWAARDSYERAEDEGGEEENEGDEVDGGNEVDEVDVIFTFRHLGREFFRWLRVVKVMEGKGWIRQLYEVDRLSKRNMGKEGWKWISEDISVKLEEKQEEEKEEVGEVKL